MYRLLTIALAFNACTLATASALTVSSPEVLACTGRSLDADCSYNGNRCGRCSGKESLRGSDVRHSICNVGVVPCHPAQCRNPSADPIRAGLRCFPMDTGGNREGTCNDKGQCL